MEPQAAVFDVMGALFDLTAVRPRIEELGAPARHSSRGYERTLHAAAALTHVGRFSPLLPAEETRSAGSLAEAAELRVRG